MPVGRERGVVAGVDLPEAGDPRSNPAAVLAELVVERGGLGEGVPAVGPRGSACPTRTSNSWGSSSMLERAEPSPDAGDVRVGLDLEQRAVALVAPAERGLLLLGIDDHRAELVHDDVFAVPTDPPLPEDDRTGGVEPDRQRGERQHRREHTSRAAPG